MSKKVTPKKWLGQHFLTSPRIAQRLADALSGHGEYSQVLEIGPGMGVLTEWLLQRNDFTTHLVELDDASVTYLKDELEFPEERLLATDFLQYDWARYFEGSFALTGNLPYNISSPIFFKVLELRQRIPEVVCMIQREVAERICAGPGSKTYGILSVLLQAFYTAEYLFTVKPGVFNPPPKVDSAVIRLQRNATGALPCDEALFKTLVKTAFGQRRKMLRNTLKERHISERLPEGHPLLTARPETLSVADFVFLAQRLSSGADE